MAMALPPEAREALAAWRAALVTALPGCVADYLLPLPPLHISLMFGCGADASACLTAVDQARDHDTATAT